MPLGANYRKLLTASALSNLADGVFQLALPLLALRITRDPSAVAGVVLAGRLPWLLFALQAGALADRLDRRRTMVNVDVARVVLIGALAAVAGLEQERLWVLYAIAFLLGIGETMFDTAAQSVMPMVVGSDDLPRANARLYSAEIILNQFVGPPLGGLLAAVAIALAFAGSAACYLVAALALLAMRGRFRPQRQEEVPPRLRTDIAEGVRYLWGNRLLRTLAFMVGVMNLASLATWSVLPLFAVEPGPMGLSGAGFGLFLAANALGMVAGTMVAPGLEARLGRARALQVSVCANAGLCAAPLVPGVVGAATAFIVSGIISMPWNVITVSLRQRITPEHLLGRVNAGYRLVAWGSMPLGAALGGLVAELLSLRWVFALAGLSSLLLLACFTVVTDEAMDAADVAPRSEPLSSPAPSPAVPEAPG